MNYIPEEFVNNINFKAILKKEDNIIIIVIKCEDIVHSFSFEFMDSVSKIIKRNQNFMTIY